MGTTTNGTSGLDEYSPRHGPKLSSAQDSDDKKKKRQDQDEETIIKDSVENVPFVLRSLEEKNQPSDLPPGQNPSIDFTPEAGNTGNVKLDSSASARAAHAVKYFASHGWTQAQAIGITANLLRESNLNPNASGDSGLATGIAQWHPDRQQAFREQFGKNIKGSSLDEQLSFVNYELKRGSERQAGIVLGTAKTPEEAAAIVSRNYERPRETTAEARKRGQIAAKLAANVSAAPPTA